MNRKMLETLQTAGNCPVVVAFKKASGPTRRVTGIVQTPINGTNVVIILAKGYRIISLDSIRFVSLQLQSPPENGGQGPAPQSKG